MHKEDDFSRLELRLRNCIDNYRYFRSRVEPGTKMLVLVKANAYGHGAVEFASMLRGAGVDYFAVAYPVEGIELRKAGISTPILVLTAGNDFYDEIIQYRLEPSIPNVFSLKKFAESLRKLRIENYPIHIKLDTGMHRLGFSTGELEGALGASSVKVDRQGNHNIKIGFAEPRSDGDSNAKIANILEYGKHGQPAKPFLKPAKSSTRSECISAMQQKFEEEVRNI